MASNYNDDLFTRRSVIEALAIKAEREAAELRKLSEDGMSDRALFLEGVSSWLKQQLN